jgi:hypothetical protein
VCRHFEKFQVFVSVFLFLRSCHVKNVFLLFAIIFLNGCHFVPRPRHTTSQTHTRTNGKIKLKLKKLVRIKSFFGTASLCV